MDAEFRKAQFKSMMVLLRALTASAEPELAEMMDRELTRFVIQPLKLRYRAKVVGKENETVVQFAPTGHLVQS